jgi:fatty acid desaturase
VDDHQAMTSLREEWTVPSTLYGSWAVVKNTVPFFLLIGAAPHLQQLSPFAPWLLMPLIGLFAYRISIVMHDCVHGTLFKTKRGNDIVGRLLGAITGIDFRKFSELHRKHHRIYGCPGDPQGFHYLGLKNASRIGFYSHLLKPLLGLNLLQVFRESHLHPKNIRRQWRSKDALTVVTVQAAIALIVSGVGAYPWLILLPLASSITFGLFFSQLRGVAEHLAMGSTVEDFSVRSHAPHWLDRIFLYDLNFNYHREHHLHPHCPSRHLPAIHEASGTKLVNRSMFTTIGHFLP